MTSPCPILSKKENESVPEFKYTLLFCLQKIILGSTGRILCIFVTMRNIEFNSVVNEIPAETNIPSSDEIPAMQKPKTAPAKFDFSYASTWTFSLVLRIDPLLYRLFAIPGRVRRCASSCPMQLPWWNAGSTSTRFGVCIQLRLWKLYREQISCVGTCSSPSSLQFYFSSVLLEWHQNKQASPKASFSGSHREFKFWIFKISGNCAGWTDWISDCKSEASERNEKTP